MDPTRLGLVVVAAFLAGGINAVAGGGSLLTFPALLAAGLPPVTASATNTVALAPGSLAAAAGYRAELRPHWTSAALLAAAAIVGSLAGASLLLSLDPRVFARAVPVLVLGATVLLFAQERVAAWARTPEGVPTRNRLLLVSSAVAVVSVYGGYFGAGIGIVTLGLLALLSRIDIHGMNAIKTVVVGAINGSAALFFLARSAVDLPYASLMAASALGGGYLGARLARRLPPRVVSRGVVAFGALLSLALALRYWRSL
ncbi:MAG: sulfite exporter TauE/SafE family protein [Polyangiaceae bacterium]|nr:sulfite exporter TauE/SafE family protein [Polyangiaceae bacterium]